MWESDCEAASRYSRRTLGLRSCGRVPAAYHTKWLVGPLFNDTAYSSADDRTHDFRGDDGCRLQRVMIMEVLEHVLTAMRVIPHLAALGFAYVLAARALNLLPPGGSSGTRDGRRH